MSPAEDAITDGVGDGGVGEVIVPMLWLELASDDGAPSLLSVLQDLEKVVALMVLDRGDGEVVDDQDVDLAKRASTR